MSTTPTRRHAADPASEPDLGYRPGPLGRLGVAVTRHARLTAVVWLLVIVGLGAFAPRVESELSGAGWQANGSDSVTARELAQEHFGGNASTAIQVVVHSTDGPLTSTEGQQVVARATALLQEESRIAEVVQPQPGATLSEDGTTAVSGGRCERRPQRDGASRRRPQGTVAGPLHLGDPGEPDRRLAALVGLQRGQPVGDAEVRALLLAGDARDPGARFRRPRGRRAAADPHIGRTRRLGWIAGADQPARAGLDLGDELRDDVRPRPRHRLRALRRGPLPGRAGPSRAALHGVRSPRPWTPPGKPCCSPARPSSSRCPQ